VVDFHGAKLAFLLRNELLVYKRDDDASIPFPGRWDFPGGGKEGNETPEHCVLRELAEEFAVELPADRLLYRRDYVVPNRSAVSCFFVAKASDAEIATIEFGPEGQYWKMMAIDEYLALAEGVPNLQHRLRDYLKFAGRSRS